MPLKTGKYKKIPVVLLLLLMSTGCALFSQENEGAEVGFSGIAIENAQNYSIYDLEDGRYLYEIYNWDKVVVLRGILHKCPRITVYDSRYLEVSWGAGTGVWFCGYYDLETGFWADPLQSPRYVGDGMVALVVEDGEGERVLRLTVPFFYSEFCEDIKLDFATENEILIPAVCLNDISMECDKIKINYRKKGGGEEIILIDNPADR